MKLKRSAALALSLTLAAALAAPAFAAEEPVLLAPMPEESVETDGTGAEIPKVDVPAPGGGYNTVITINGEALGSFDFDREVPGWGSQQVTWQVKDLSAAPAGYVPMRAVVQADYGSCYWSQEENEAWFYLGDFRIVVRFADLSVLVDDTAVEGVAAVLQDGVTYLPVSVIDGLEGYSVTDLSADGAESYEIATPNGAPLIKLARKLMKTAGIYGGMQTDGENLEAVYGESLGLKAEYMTECVGFLPMMTSPDTLLVGKVAEGKTEALKAALEAYRKSQEETFSWYLSQNLPKVENAKFATSGEWFLFVIGENADEAVAAFEASVAEMAE